MNLNQLIDHTNFGFVGAVTSAVVALLSVLLWLRPGAVGRRAAGWVVAAAVVRALADAPDWLPGAYEVGGAAGAFAPRMGGFFASLVLLGEAARVAAAAGGRRRLSPGWHLLAVPTWLIFSLGVPKAFDGLTISAVLWCFVCLLVLLAYVITALGRATGREPDRARRWALRSAVAGLALADLGSIMVYPGAVGFGTLTFLAIAGGGFVTAWLLPRGFGHRLAVGLALACGGGVLLMPAAAEWNAQRAEAALRAGWQTRAATMAGHLGVSPAIDELAMPEHVGPVLARALEVNLREASRDAAQRDVYCAVVRDGQFWKLEPEAGLQTTRLIAQRALLDEEVRGVAAGHAVVTPALGGRSGGFVAVLAPVIGRAAGKPLAWFVMEFPAAVWTGRIDNARWTGGLLAGLGAVFAAAGLVLVGRQMLEAEKQLKLERAEAADRAKSEFLAFLSHELRTPMQTVLGRAELLRRGGLSAEQGRQVDGIESEGKLLLRLVTDLLDLGTIDAGKLQLRGADFSLRGLMDELTEAQRSRAAAKGVALRLEIAPDVPDALHADAARVRQVLGNLLSNALKYTERGEVCVGAMRDATPAPGPDCVALVFTVADTGPGLPAGQIERLFTLFTRLDSGASYRREGTGVGLALVKRLCEFMGGSVAAANRPEGGAVFTVRLLLQLARRTAVAPVVIAVEPCALVPARGRRALVIDDHAAVRSWLNDALLTLGFDVVAVADGEAAVAAVRQGHFQVALVDVNLPGRDGMSVARELRTVAPGLRIVGCSAEAFSATREAALAAGMDAYLTKPVSLDELAAAIGKPVAREGAGDIFSRLDSSEMSTRARETLRAEWPELRRETERALVEGDPAALRRLGHYLQSTALLAHDAALGEVCAELATTGEAAAARTRLEAVETLVKSWPGREPEPGGRG